MRHVIRRLTLAFALALVAASLDPSAAAANFTRSRGQARMKACVSNMKTIEGACELYAMEKDVRDPSTVTVEAMRREHYLRVEPCCPAGGTYRIVARVDEKGRRIYEPVCSLHGTIEEAPARVDVSRTFGETMDQFPILYLALFLCVWLYARPFLHAANWILLGGERLAVVRSGQAAGAPPA